MSRDRIDALLWFAIPCLVFSLIPIGFASGDGVGHSLAFASGRWHLNPNHLLFEPLGAWWQTTLMALGYPREPFDALKLLSILSGSLAVGLFRLLVAPRVSASRFAANYGTAWVALSSAFLRLWISDETHMIQMPWIVLMIWAALRRRGLLLGVMTGIATLTFVSNVLFGLALVRRRFIPFAVGLAITTIPPLLLAWPRTTSFFSWLTRYGGGAVSPRAEQAYGFHGLLESTLRAGYGAACAMVDLTSRGTNPFVWGPMLAAAIVLLYALRHADREILGIVIPMSIAIAAFGIFWNDSDDQFWFQLAPIAGMLAARLRSRAIVALGACVQLWNAGDVTLHRVFYPRAERIAMVEQAANGACLVVTPGFDEAELLLQISHHVTAEKLSITDLATELSPDTGLALLRLHVEHCLASGGRVVLIDLYDTPRDRNPWKFLRLLGYERDAVERELSRYPACTRVTLRPSTSF